MAGERRTIRVETLARVEGEGSLHIDVEEGRVVRSRLEIFEPPRLFEAMLRGRPCAEVPDITARICGICPIAYQMSAVHALEAALGVRVDGPLRALRRLVYCGEWIESHALHVFMLHAPDFLGYDDGIAMSRDHPEPVVRGLRMKKAGNDLIRLLAGREVHPVNVRVGGFHRVPARRELAPVRERLARGRDDALATVRWVATLPIPDLEREIELVALRHPDEYPFNEGRIVSSSGLDVAVRDFETHFGEEHVAHSTALWARRRGGGAYLVGPVARYGLNADRLAPIARDAAREAGLGADCRNPFRSIVVRAVEMLHAFDEAVRIIDGYEPPDRPFVDAEPRASEGHGATEAPRGLLYQRYRIDEAGRILDARIVPPTAQNQGAIEEDLRALVQRHLDLDDGALTRRCEQAIRNHDPCISCAAHFLRLQVRRR